MLNSELQETTRRAVSVLQGTGETATLLANSLTDPLIKLEELFMLYQVITNIKAILGDMEIAVNGKMQEARVSAFIDRYKNVQSEDTFGQYES